jgi:hypothetical protein
MSIAVTESIAPDGGPLISVDAVSRLKSGWQLRGTACVYEGTLLVECETVDGRLRHLSTTASAGGPRRGSWMLAVEGDVRQVTLHPEEMQEGYRTAALRRVSVWVARDH